MGLADELEKLQRLRQEGVLTEEEFAQAKQKLLEDDDTPRVSAAPSPPQTVNLSLKEGLDEIVDEESTLGQAANRYIDYKTTSAIIGAVLFIIALIVFAVIFSNAQKSFNRDFNSFPSSAPWFNGR